MSNDIMMEHIIRMVIILYIVLFLYSIISYLFSSFALYKMAKNAELESSYPVLAWIPVAQYVTMGKLMEEYSFIPQMALVYPLSMIIGGGLCFIPYVGFVISFALAYLCFYGYYAIFKRYTKHYVIMTVFNILTLGLFACFFLFSLRNKESVFPK